MSNPKKSRKKAAAPFADVGALAARRLELQKRLYALASKPDSAEEFEAVRLELVELGGGGV